MNYSPARIGFLALCVAFSFAIGCSGGGGGGGVAAPTNVNGNWEMVVVQTPTPSDTDMDCDGGSTGSLFITMSQDGSTITVSDRDTGDVLGTLTIGEGNKITGFIGSEESGFIDQLTFLDVGTNFNNMDGTAAFTRTDPSFNVCNMDATITSKRN